MLPASRRDTVDNRGVDAATFRQALGRFLTGVTVVTTTGPRGEPVGMTANAFTSVSLDPPLVLVCVARSAATFPAIDAASRYGVHILSAAQESISTTFARSAGAGADKFADIPWSPADDGLPLLEGCLARLQCTIVDRVDAGDHVVYLGYVDRVEDAGAELAPLGFYQGRYAALA